LAGSGLRSEKNSNSRYTQEPSSPEGSFFVLIQTF
jgi:hypothetical protein